MTLWQRIKNWWSPPPKTTPLKTVGTGMVREMPKGGYYEGKKRKSGGDMSLTRDVADNLPDVVTLAVLHNALSTPAPTACIPDVDSDLVSRFASGVGEVCGAVGDVVSSTFE